VRLWVNHGRSAAPSQAIPQRIYISTVESLAQRVINAQIPRRGAVARHASAAWTTPASAVVIE
jgi:hypothetical protein